MNAEKDEPDIRKKILLTAGRIFAEKGFADTKIREICTAAEVNLAAVNYYFGDKENLYIEAVSFARNSRAEENPLSVDLSEPEDKLRQFILTLVNRTAGINEPPWEVQLLLREVLFPTEACRRLIDEYFRPFFNLLLAIVGELSPRPLDLALAYRLGCSIVGQVMYLRFTSRMNALFLPESMGEKHFHNEQIAEHVYQFSLAAIRSDSFWNSLPDTPGTSPAVPATKAAE